MYMGSNIFRIFFPILLVHTCQEKSHHNDVSTDSDHCPVSQC